MKKRLGAMLVIVIAATLPSTLLAQGVVIKKNHMKYNGLRYFKVNAQEMELGAWGRKNEPINAGNYLERKNSFASAVEDVNIDLFTFTSSNGTRAQVTGNFDLGQLGWQVSGNDFYERLKEGDYVFAKISIKNKTGKFLRTVNGRRSWIDQIKERNDHRIVTSVIVVLRAEEARRVGLRHQGTFSGSIGPASGDAFRLSINTDIVSESESRFTVAPGTVYAYMLDKPIWDANKKKKRKKILDLRDDQHGPS